MPQIKYFVPTAKGAEIRFPGHMVPDDKYQNHLNAEQAYMVVTDFYVLEILKQYDGICFYDILHRIVSSEIWTIRTRIEEEDQLNASLRRLFEFGFVEHGPKDVDEDWDYLDRKLAIR